MPTTNAATTASTTASTTRVLPEGLGSNLGSKLAYLTRALKTPTIGRVWERPGRAGPGRELVPRGVPDRGAGATGRRPGVRRHHDAGAHRALPAGQDPGGVQPR